LRCEIDLHGTYGCNAKLVLDGACTQPARSITLPLEGCDGLNVHFEMDGGQKENAVGKLEVIEGDGKGEVFAVKECKLRLTGKPPLGDRCLFMQETCDVTPA